MRYLKGSPTSLPVAAASIPECGRVMASIRETPPKEVFERSDGERLATLRPFVGRRRDRVCELEFRNVSPPALTVTVSEILPTSSVAFANAGPFPPTTT